MASRRTTTPGRVTRSRGTTPLPALTTRQSHAYGAAGKADLHNQVTQSQAAMEEAFTSTHQSRAQGGSFRPPRAITEEPSTDGDTRPGTALQESALYENGHPQPRVPSASPPPPSPSPPPRRSPVQQTQTHSQRNRKHEPSTWRVGFRTVTRFLGDPSLCAFVVLLYVALAALITLFGTIYAWAPLPSAMVPFRDRVFNGARIAMGLQSLDEVEYLWLRYLNAKIGEEHIPDLANMSAWKLQFLYNRNTYGRLGKLENITAAMDSRIGLAEKTLLEIERILPGNMALVEENGEMVVPGQFWQALLDKMQNSDISPLWDAFLKHNAALVAREYDEYSKSDVEPRALVSREDFQKAIIKSQDDMDERFSQRIQSFRLHFFKELDRKIAENLGPKVELSSLAAANLLKNMDRRLHETNYFSTGNGAVINPHYTSTTFGTLNSLQSAFRTVFWMTGFSGITRPHMTPNPPVAALLGWEESTQCWCAAPSQDEKALAQLTVNMPVRLSPTGITIEHVPVTGTRDIKAAPQDFEVWAQVQSAKEAKRIKDHFDYHNPFPECGHPPNGEDNWACIHSGTYNIWSTNYVQIFSVNSAWAVDDLWTSKVAFRVVKNWGADHTCLYRVRLTGEEEGLDTTEADQYRRYYGSPHQSGYVTGG